MLDYTWGSKVYTLFGSKLCSPAVSWLQLPPTAEEAGYCDVVEVREIGDTNVVVFRQGGER